MAEESSGILSKLSDIATGKAQKDAISNSSVGELAKALGESMGKKFKSVQEGMAKLASKGDSKEAVKAVEAGRESAREAAETRGILTSIRDTLSNSFGKLKEGDGKSGGLLAGLLGGIGSGIGAIAKAIGSIGMNFGIGLAALGAGIAGFMIALGGADYIVGLMGSDGESLKTIIQNFFGAFDKKAAAMMGGLIAISLIMAKLNIGKFAFMTAMTALGFGIAGFFTGIMVGDFLISKIGAEGSKDHGKALGALIKNFFGAFTPETAVMMGGLLTIAGTLAAVGAKVGVADSPANALKIAGGLMTGLTAMGFGLAGFFTGIMAGDFMAKKGAEAGKLDGSTLATLMSNFLGAFKGATGITVLMSLLTAAGTIGLGMAANPAAAVKASGGIIMGMTAIGLGLAGFFTGITIGDFITGAMTKAGTAPGATIKTLMDNFFSIFDNVAKVTALMTILTAGGLIGGAAAVSPAAAIKASGGLIMGMTSIGLGLAGFFTGIAIGDFLTSVLTPAGKAPGGTIKTLMNNFFGIFDDPAKVSALIAILVAAGGVAALGVAATPAAAVIASAGIIMGMTAIGLGLAGFMVGILAGDLIASLGAAGGFDGSAMNKLLGNLLDSFAGVDVKVLLALFGLIGVASLNPIGVVAGMTALGLGLAAFMVGVVAADWIASVGGDGSSLITLFGNIGKAIGEFLGGMGEGVFKSLGEIKDSEIDRLGKIGKAISDLGIGMLAFAGGKAAGGMADALSKGLGWIGLSDGPFAAFIKLSKDKDIDVDRLSAIGGGIGSLGAALEKVAAVDTAKLQANVEQMMDMGIIEDTRIMSGMKKFVAGKLGGMMGTDKKGKPSTGDLDPSKGAPVFITNWPTRLMSEGGLVTGTGIGVLHGTPTKPELVLDNQAAAVFMKAATLLTGSQALEQARGGGQPVIINNVDNSQKSIANSNRATNFAVPTSPHNRQSTKQMLDEAYAFG